MEFDLLRSVPLLRDLDDAEMAVFTELLRFRDVKPGERILAEGTPVDSLYMICRGVMHVRRLAQTSEMLLGRLGPGAFFGEINLFDPGAATASIDVLEAGQLAVIGYESLRDFMTTNPAAGYKIVSAMMTEMSRRLRQAGARLVNSAYWSTSESAGEVAEA